MESAHVRIRTLDRYGAVDGNTGHNRTPDDRIADPILWRGLLIGIPALFALFELFPYAPIVDTSGEIRIKIYLIAIVSVAAGMVAIAWNDW